MHKARYLIFRGPSRKLDDVSVRRPYDDRGVGNCTFGRRRCLGGRGARGRLIDGLVCILTDRRRRDRILANLLYYQSTGQRAAYECSGPQAISSNHPPRQPVHHETTADGANPAAVSKNPLPNGYSIATPVSVTASTPAPRRRLCDTTFQQVSTLIQGAVDVPSKEVLFANRGAIRNRNGATMDQ